MNELKRNGSGYYDDTAYKAMRNYEEEKKMCENSKEVREGEIWLIETKRGYEEALILAANERTSFVCLLKDQSFGADYIEVPSVSLKYTRLDMVVYKLNTQFVEYVKTVNSKRFLEIIEEFKKYLWFCDGDKCYSGVDNSETEKSMKEELEKVSGPDYEAMYNHIKNCADDLAAQLEEAKRKIESLECDTPDEKTVMKLSIERNLYMEMYQNLLEKVTASHSLPIQPMTAPIAF